MWLSPSFAESQAAGRACAEGNCEAVIASLERSLRRQPGDFLIHYQLGLCYAGGCRAHALANPDMAVPYLRRALLLMGTEAPARDRAAALGALGNALAASQAQPHGAALRAALDCQRKAARIYIAHEDETSMYYRFDIVSVIIPASGKPTTTIYRDAFRDE